MYRLLIVDDEEIITDTLYEVLSQKFENRLEIYKAYTAKEALNWLHSTRIDIVLTDIKMPGMNGIDLMKEIIKMWPRSKIIFLTGHSEFEYAYTAIKQKNVHFILKTEPYNVVINTVDNTILDIDNENALSQIIASSVEQHIRINFLEQESLVKSLMLNQATPFQVSEMQKRFNENHITLKASEQVMLVLCRCSSSDEHQSEFDNGIYKPLIAYWDLYMEQQFHYTYIKLSNYEIAWIIQIKEELKLSLASQLSKIIEGNLELVQYKLSENSNLHVSFTITEHPVNWDSLYFNLNRLRDLQKFSLSENIPLLQIDYGHIPPLNNQVEQLKLMNKIQQFSSWLDMGKSKEIKSLFEELSMFTSSNLLNALQINEMYYTIATALLGYVNRNKMYDSIFDLSRLMKLDSHSTTASAFDYLFKASERIISKMQDDEQSRSSTIMKKICEYIDLNLSEDLSLVKLAEIHYFNPSYLSRLFKQEQGINLSEYIDQRRIVLAKQLLADSEQKIRDISCLVGYEAAHSFTRFFKKATGLTPQEYRDSIFFQKQ